MLSRSEINVLKRLAIHCGAGGNVMLGERFRASALPLWRRGLVQVWYRQSPECGLQGPYFGLSMAGSRLAAAFHDGHEHRGKPRLGRLGQTEG
jgi:hypothetical protein